MCPITIRNTFPITIYAYFISLCLQAYTYNGMVQMLIPDLLAVTRVVIKFNKVTALTEAKIKCPMVASCKFDFVCKLKLERKLCQKRAYFLTYLFS